MRQIVLDTETTGLEFKDGHRIIEIGAVEIIDRHLTDRTLHFYLDPERDIDFEASEVHGLTREQLTGKPKFREVAEQFIDFASGAQWVIHNAPFDLGFLDFELQREGLAPCSSAHAGVLDTLALARETYTGRRNNLDALCERLGVDRSARAFHGALLDARLLAQVYLALTRGQDGLFGEIEAPSKVVVPSSLADDSGIRPIVLAPTEEELAAHRAYLDDMLHNKDGSRRCLWLELEQRG